MRRVSPASASIVVVSAAVSAAMLAGILSPPVAAQTARSGGGQNAQLMQQLQQLAAERTAMQAEQTKLKKELEDVKKERDALKATQTGAAASQRARAESEAAAMRAAREKESLEGELNRTKARTEEIVTKFRETVATLREVETDRTTAKQAVARQEQELKACVAANDGLYKLNDEVLTHFSDQGFWSGLARAEPFTKLKRVQLENIIDGYRTRAQDAQYVPGMTPPVAPPPTTSR